MDDVDAELVRLTLWALFAAAAVTAGRPTRDVLGTSSAARYADDLLADATERFPFLAERSA